MTLEAPAPTPPSFYPNSTIIATPYGHELSWLFNELRDVAVHLDGYAEWKEEFFGRVGARVRTVPASASLSDVLFTALREAYELLGMIEIGMVMHDWTPVVVHPRSVGVDIEPFEREALASFYALRGVSIE